MSIPKFSIENSKLINMIMVIVFVFGIFTMLNMPKEEMPAVEFGAFIIIVSYRGVSPLEMEQLVAKKIEDYVLQIENIDYASTTCREGLAVIYVSMLPNADIDKAWDDLTTELEKVNDLPEDASDPTIIRMNMREVNEICTISIGGDFSPDAMREIADDFKDELLNVENISKVDISGTQEKQIWVEADSTKLDQYGLTLNDLINAINMRNMNVPAGTIKFGRAEFIIRTVGEFESTEQIADLIVKMDPNGRAVRIGNVAEVTETLEERTKIGKLNRKPAVNLEIYQMADGNIIKIMKDVRKVSNTFQEKIEGLIVEVRNDGSKEVNESLTVLGRNAIIGIILVFFTLMLFIGWKNALFAAWGIPFSFLFAFILMNYFDITMNNLSLFALILVLGMIVDDAIIVLENIHRHREAGMDLKTAAVKGTEEIMWPVISAVATTVAAFIPMLIMKGMMGKFMRLFPIVVSIALLASLFESLVILPSHVAEFSKEKKKKTKKREPHKLTVWMQKKYRKAIKWALCHRAILLSIVMLSLFLSIAAVGLKLVKIEFFPKQPGQTIILNLSTPIGTNLDKTNEVVSKIEDYIFEMTEKEDIEAVVSTVGHFVENHRYVVETSNAEIKIDLREADDMKYSDSQIKESLREFLDEVPGLYAYKFLDPKRGPPTGNDVELRVQGDDLKKLEYIGNYILSELEKIPGVYDAETSFSAGKKEIQIIPYSDKIALYGLNVQQIASTISTASYGMTVSKFRGTGLDEYDIIVRIKEKQIKDLTKLKDLKIRTRQGDLIPLKELAEFRITSGYSQIEHRDGKRVIIITGNVGMYKNGNSLRKRTPDEVTEILIGNKLLGREGVLSGFETKFPGYQLEYGGVKEEQTKSFNSLYLAFIVAMLLVYTILATQFKSWVQPVIVMATIPFAIIGVIFGLVVTQLPFSLMTLISVVALVGVVVNDSLVLVDFVNKERDRGVDRWNSLINAGTVRLRPIILTTITTIAGFMPIMLSTASATADWKPMAVSIAFGLAFATTLTLFVIPVIYSLVDSIFGRLHLTRFEKHLSFDKAMTLCEKYEKNSAIKDVTSKNE